VAAAGLTTLHFFDIHDSILARRQFNPLTAELNPICYLLVLLELNIFSTLAG
jgi:hypothetical protein